MSDVEPAEPPALLGEEPVAKPIVEEVPEEPSEATVAETAPVPEPEETVSSPEPPPVAAVEEDTPISQPEPAPAYTAVDNPVESEHDAIAAAPAETLAPISEDAAAPLQKAASVPHETEPATVAKSATIPSQAAAAPTVPDPAVSAVPETTSAPDLSAVKTEVAKAAAAADTKSLTPSKKDRAKAKILGKVVPKVAALRAPKEVTPLLVLLTQKKKAGVDVQPIVESMLKVGAGP
ncbi:predicted protein [Plenodomus lingam JN3]|uniref:Predicted protein n=2 Tax=Leptosphaeria maculans TaxID=5022 RepID=E4ZVK9_LEPMJ|nr:predicted protein [Plenodomus lingam JN3]CBX95635.1 predicted protein [Plenodomus lingam JN3]